MRTIFMVGKDMVYCDMDYRPYISIHGPIISARVFTRRNGALNGADASWDE